MKSHLKRLVHLGITEEHNDTEILRIKLLNRIALVVTISCFTIGTVFVSTGLYEHSITAWCGILVGLVVLWLASRFKTTIALYFFTLTCLFGTTLNIFFVGDGYGLQYALMQYPFTVALLVDNRRYVGFITVMAIILFVAIHVYFMHYEPIIETSSPATLSFAGFLSSILVGYYAAIFHLNENQNQRQKLKEYIQEINAKNTDLEQFAGIASHDMKEPLRSISGFANLLEKQLKKKENITEMELSAVQYISSTTETMSKLLDDLLQYSAAGIGAKECEAVNLNNTLKTVRENLHQRIKDAEAIIEFNALPTVNANSSEMLQLFQNLISNSIKYQPQHTNSSDMSAKHIPQVYIQSNRGNGHFIIKVADNGIGMEKEYLEKVFEPFKRIKNKVKYEGTGLGLATCKKIVENYGGKIHAESEVGQGSTFILLFPAN